MIEIDGSIGEGGGQILRMSLALAAVLKKDVHIFNIRKKRTPSGLKAQHLSAVRAIAKITNAKVEGDVLGSEEIYFYPKEISGGSMKINIGTAGSISLILQAVLPAVCFSKDKVKLEIVGGTDVKWSPPVDYLINVFVPIIKKMGAHVNIQLIERGHYPKGGGLVKAEITPVNSLNSIELTEQGEITHIRGISHAHGLPKHVAIRQAKAAREVLSALNIDNINIDIENIERISKRKSPGSGITLWAVTKNTVIGSDALGERGKRAEIVGKEAAEKLVSEIKSGATVDKHMADMLIIWLLLAKGTSVIKTSDLTMHARTCIDLAKIFTNAEIKVKKAENITEIAIRGISYEREK